MEENKVKNRAEIKSQEKLLEMDFIIFYKENTQRFSKKGTRPCYLRSLVSNLYMGKLRWGYEKRVRKVKDLYSLSKGEIASVYMAGKRSWERLNEILTSNDLPVIQLPYKYTVTYPESDG